MRIGVIGLGNMGRNHARVLSEIADLVAVCDTCAAALATWHGSGTKFLDPMKMLKDPDMALDAVVVAVPTSRHAVITMTAIEAGIDVLVEKPLAGNVGDAQVLVETAKEKGVFLATGHIERFNPAIVALKDRWSQLGEVHEIGFERLGPFPEHVRDTGVIYDLATHDFDLLRYLASHSPIISLESRFVIDKGMDVSVAAIALLKDGGIATFRESWTTPTKIRRVTVWGEQGMFVADLLRQELMFYENNYIPVDWGAMEPFFGVSEGDVTRYKIKKQEPLRLELQAFLDAANGRGRDCPTGEDGLEAVRLAEWMKEAAGYEE